MREVVLRLTLHRGAIPMAEMGALVARLDRLCDEGEALFMGQGSPEAGWSFTVEKIGNNSKPRPEVSRGKP